MKIKKHLLGSLAAAAVLTWAAIALAPDADFIQFVVPFMKAGAVTALALAAIAFIREEKMEEFEKKALMSGFLAAVLVPSYLAAGAFVHESRTSWTPGEVHWHADFEFFVETTDGEIERRDLIDPAKFCQGTEHESRYMCSVNDRTGSTEYHEHNDQRIHVEGTFKERRDASLAAFFETFGGELTNSRIVYPTNDETIRLEEDGPYTLKILVHQGVGVEREWCAVGENVPRDDICSSHGRLADSPSDYVISPFTRRPSIDDIFIVYDSRSLEEALKDVRKDDRYRGKGLRKTGEGYE